MKALYILFVFILISCKESKNRGYIFKDVAMPEFINEEWNDSALKHYILTIPQTNIKFSPTFLKRQLLKILIY
ncbi:hypothetical protein C21_00672 [Arenibacter sp. NBRC 103722]|nr:hypothetical protein C21_00672 [Arenibacter sp. NBRC 103722]